MPDDDVTQLRRAVDLVLHDARASMGADVLGVAFENDDLPAELDWLKTPHFAGPSRRPFDQVHAYAYVKNEPGGAGIWFPPGISFDEILVRVAERFQEQALERSTQFFGIGFPACPEHPNGAPLFAQRVDGQAAWVCTSGGTTRIPIGQF